MRRLAALAALSLVGCRQPAPDPFPPSPEEIALTMQCHDRHGLLAIARGEHTWVTCYQGKKKIWSVRL